jgi:hypothetical protein
VRAMVVAALGDAARGVLIVDETGLSKRARNRRGWLASTRVLRVGSKIPRLESSLHTPLCGGGG